MANFEFVPLLLALHNNSAHLWAPEKARCSNSAHLWAPEKAKV